MAVVTVRGDTSGTLYRVICRANRGNGKQEWWLRSFANMAARRSHRAAAGGNFGGFAGVRIESEDQIVVKVSTSRSSPPEP